jgi:hypothetical protein
MSDSVAAIGNVLTPPSMVYETGRLWESCADADLAGPRLVSKATALTAATPPVSPTTSRLDTFTLPKWSYRY